MAADGCDRPKATSQRPVPSLTAGAETVLGHSVAGLCQEVARLAPEAEGRCGAWAALDQYYIPTRYPDALPGGIPSDVFTPEQAAEAIDRANEVAAFAAGRLGSGSA